MGDELGNDGFVDPKKHIQVDQINAVLDKLQALRTDGHIEIDHEIYKIDLDNDFAIRVDMLSEEFSTQGARYAYYSAMVARAKSAVGLAKLRVEEHEARVSNKIKNLAVGMKKPPTIPAIEAEVVADKDVMEAKRELIKAQQDLDLVKGFAKAVEMKSDMLMQLGAHMRAEMSNLDFSMKDEHQAMKTQVEQLRET